MKDLYTFDTTEHWARVTYTEVQAAYKAFFDELGIPYLVAEADSGAMGGNLSHEYHFESQQGEDKIMCCDSCNYVANEEVARRRPGAEASTESLAALRVWLGVSKDRKTFVAAWFPGTDGGGSASKEEVNLHALKAAEPTLDTAVEDPSRLWRESTKPGKIIHLLDPRLRLPQGNFSLLETANWASGLVESLRASLTSNSTRTTPLEVSSIRTGDACPMCNEGSLLVRQVVEVGHTFHLGHRYSKPLSARYKNEANAKTDFEMGCHGIGVSRLVGAVAGIMADDKGLNWPPGIAPFEVVVVRGKENVEDAEKLYDGIIGSGHIPALDAVLDDRDRNIAYKLKDADQIGYPVIVVLGKAWAGTKKRAEIQCRRLGVIELVGEDEVAEKVAECLRRLKSSVSS